MKLFLVGATGQTGSILLDRALEQGHLVTAYVRSPEKIKITHENLEVISGDLLSENALTEAMKDHEAILSCLGGDANHQSTIITDMTKCLIKAMQVNHISRIASIATAGVHNEFSFVTNLIVKLFYKQAISDHKGAVELMMSTELDYTIARPLSLISGTLTKKYRCTPIGVPKGGKNISREDLADFLLDAVEHNKHLKETVGLAY